jgi:hypothetical protein
MQGGQLRQAVLEQVDGALGPAEFNPRGCSLDLDVGRCAVPPRAVVSYLLAALGELGRDVQRPLAGDLVAGKGVANRLLLQRDRLAAAGQSAPML